MPLKRKKRGTNLNELLLDHWEFIQKCRDTYMDVSSQARPPGWTWPWPRLPRPGQPWFMVPQRVRWKHPLKGGRGERTLWEPLSMGWWAASIRAGASSAATGRRQQLSESQVKEVLPRQADFWTWPSKRVDSCGFREWRHSVKCRTPKNWKGKFLGRY